MDWNEMQDRMEREELPRNVAINKRNLEHLVTICRNQQAMIDALDDGLSNLLWAWGISTVCLSVCVLFLIF